MADSQRKTANLFKHDREKSISFTTDTNYYMIGAATLNNVEMGATVTITDTSVKVTSTTGGYGANYLIDAKPNTDYTISVVCNKVSSGSYFAFSCRDVNGNFITGSQDSSKSTTATITTKPNTKYLDICLRFPPSDGEVEYTIVMVNEGSTALPYEPYGWQHSLRKYDTDTDIITTLPADIYADGSNATVNLKGNTVQNGTPTPQNPVMPNGTGERTANLAAGTFNINKTVNDVNVVSDIGGYFTVTGQASSAGGRTNKISDNITLPSGSYRVSIGGTINCQLCVNNASNNAFITGFYSGGSFSISSETTIYFGLNFTAGTIYNDSFYIMLQPFASDYPYEPYGYKIPISSADTTTPVYLGEVESTRKIKKYEFTGQEDWSISNNERVLYVALADHLTSNELICYCSHYQSIANISSMSALSNGECTFNNTLRWFYIKDDNYNDATSFKTYLQQQYAAGTPVTIWYVLATPTTGIVNEPLRKIGDYADIVSGITIPTITGKDTVDVETTLKPSEVSLSYTGWHDATVKEWDGSQWD